MKQRWSNPEWRQCMVQVVRQNGKKNPRTEYDKSAMAYRLRKSASTTNAIDHQQH